MNFHDLDYMIAQTRRDEERAAADQSRRVREAIQANLIVVPVTGRARAVRPSLRPAAVTLAQALAWLGFLLTGWSCRLQSRYLAEPQSSPCAGR